ncbi:hypothetical protein PTKIN_Ptkin01aG0353900 [Pterospermum kingtungense]
MDSKVKNIETRIKGIGCNFIDFVLKYKSRKYSSIKFLLFSLERSLSVSFIFFSIFSTKLYRWYLTTFFFEDPLVSTKSDGEKLEHLTKCFACWEPLANYTYFSADCGFNLDKKCVDLALKINDMGHEHPLSLQFNSKQLSCDVCGETRQSGFVYCCPPCNSAVHIECVPPPIVEVKCRQHALTLFRRRAPFICDACGIQANYVAYICCSCNIIVHKKCVSLPRVIKSKWHDHCISHAYFLQGEDFKRRDCLICHNEVNVSHGSYSCSDCSFIFHVKCVTEIEGSYFIVSQENEDEKSSDSLALLQDIKAVDPITVIERNDAGEATKRMINVVTDACYPSRLHFTIVQGVISFFINHVLNGLQSENEVTACMACRQDLYGLVYACLVCRFFLHEFCLKDMPTEVLESPFHPQHPLFWYPIFSMIGPCDTCREAVHGMVFGCWECTVGMH